MATKKIVLVNSVLLVRIGVKFEKEYKLFHKLVLTRIVLNKALEKLPSESQILFFASEQHQETQRIDNLTVQA